MAFGFKISSLAALTAAALMPLGVFYVFGNTPIAWAMVPIALLLFWRHRANIRQLLDGQRAHDRALSSADHVRRARRRDLDDGRRLQPSRRAERRQLPPRPHRERVVAALRVREAQRADERDHRAVVGAELEIREEHLAAALRDRVAQAARATRDSRRRRRRRRAARSPVASSAASAFATSTSTTALWNSRAMSACARLRRARPPPPRLRTSVSTAVFNPREAHVEIAASRASAAAATTAPCAPRSARLRERRAARIGQAEQLRRLVERLAGRVVLRVAEQPVAPDAVDVEELAVAARHEQRDERKRRPRLGEQRRQQMAFEVMDADRRLAAARSRARSQRSRRPAARRPVPGPACRRCRRGRRA